MEQHAGNVHLMCWLGCQAGAQLLHRAQFSCLKETHFWLHLKQNPTYIYINTYIPDWKLLRKLLEFFFLQYLYYLQFIRTQYWPRRVRLVSNCLLWETHKPHALSYNSCSTRTASTLSTKTYSRDETTCFIKCHLLYIPESPYLSPLKVICGFLFNKSLHAVNWKQSYWCYQACITSASERKF